MLPRTPDHRTDAGSEAGVGSATGADSETGAGFATDAGSATFAGFATDAGSADDPGNPPGATAAPANRLRAARRTAAAAAAALLLAAAATAAATAPAVALGGIPSGKPLPEQLVPAEYGYLPPHERLYAAGTDGFLEEDPSGTATWVNTADGTQRSAALPPTAMNGTVYQADATTGSVTLTDAATGDSTAIAVPAGEFHVADAFTADSVLTGTRTDTAVTSLHVVRRAADGTTTDTAVTGLPAGTTAVATSPASHGQHLTLVLTVQGARHVYVLDAGTATMHEVFAGLDTSSWTFTAGPDRLLGYDGRTASTVRWDDPDATVQTTPCPSALSGRTSAVPDGGNVLFLQVMDPGGPTDGPPAIHPLLSEPLGGGTAQTVLPLAQGSQLTDPGFTVAPDGSVLVVGGTSVADWGVDRISAPADGSTPTATPVHALPRTPARISALAYSAGTLDYLTDAVWTGPIERRDVAAAGAPVAGPVATAWQFGPLSVDSCPAGEAACRRIAGTGSGTVAFTSDSGVMAPIAGDPQAANGYSFSTSATRYIADATPTFALVDSPDTGRMDVVSLTQTGVAVDLPLTAAALWGDTVWTPGTGKGQLRPYDMDTGTYGKTVTTKASCAAPTELQADGQWIYWSCGTSAGVYDTESGASVALPAGPALLGDGFVVRHDTSANTLVVTDVHADTAGTSMAVASLGGADGRGTTWTVDKFGGGLAYVDAQQRIHVNALSNQPRSPLTLLSRYELASYDEQTGERWTGRFDLSRPTSSWTLTFRDHTGRTVSTQKGTARSGARLDVSYDGKDAATGKPVPAGTYTWTLTAFPAAGGPPLTLTGSTSF